MFHLFFKSYHDYLVLIRAEQRHKSLIGTPQKRRFFLTEIDFDLNLFADIDYERRIPHLFFSPPNNDLLVETTLKQAARANIFQPKLFIHSCDLSLSTASMSFPLNSWKKKGRGKWKFLTSKYMSNWDCLDVALCAVQVGQGEKELMTSWLNSSKLLRIKRIWKKPVSTNPSQKGCS